MAHKTCVSLLESRSARLRINGAIILTQLIRDALKLGTMARKTIKHLAKRMLASACEEEALTGAALMSVLLSFGPTGEAQCIEKFVTSWVRLCDLFESIPRVISHVLVASPILQKNPDKVLRQVFMDHNLSLMIVPDSKKKIWKIGGSQLRSILEGITAHFENIKDICAIVLEACRPEHLESVCEWYYQCSIDGKIILTETELQRIPLLFSRHASLQILNCKQFPRIVNSGYLQSKMIASLFAQLKGESALLRSGETSICVESMLSVALTLSSLLCNSSWNSGSLDSLYFSNDIFQNIRIWALELLDKHLESWAQCIAGSILGAIYKIRPLEVSDHIASVLQTSCKGLRKDLLYLLYFAEIGHVDSNCEAASIACIEQLRILAELPVADSVNVMPFALEISLVKLPKVLDIAAPIAAKLICSSSASKYLLAKCQKILVEYFDHASVASQKYHLSHLNAFISSTQLRAQIFTTIVCLMNVINFNGKCKEDADFILGVLKATIFPFVCDPDNDLQESAAHALGLLVTIVNTVEFQNGMLQELIDRSLNEPREIHRRGYILGIAKVTGAIETQCSSLELTSIVGLLSSLAKDSRSIIVQSAALRSLHWVLDQQSNSVTPLLSSDVVYLIWQVYMTDSTSNPSDTAVENILFDSISQALLVAIELLGPSMLSASTVSRICSLMVGDLIDHPSSSLLVQRTLVRAIIQIVLLKREAENVPTLLQVIKRMLDKGDAENVSVAVSCLRWLLEFQKKVLTSFFQASLTASIFNLKHSQPSPNLDFCINTIFSDNFTENPLFWISLMQTSKYLSPQAGRTVRMPLLVDNDMQLIGDSTASLKLQTDFDGLEHIDSLDKLGGLVCEKLATSSSCLVALWKSELTNDFIADTIRLALSLAIAHNPLHSNRLKLIGVKVICSLVDNFGKLSDFIDKEGNLLDSYTSQIVTIFSTLCQDEDPIVSAQAFAGLLGLCLNPDHFEFLRSHPKICSLISKKVDGVVNEENPQGPDSSGLYGLVLELPLLLQFAERSKSTLSTKAKGFVQQQTMDCIRAVIQCWTRDSLHRLIAEKLPLLLKVSALENSDEFILVGSLAVICSLQPSPESHHALAKLCSGSDNPLFPVVVPSILQRSIQHGTMSCLVSLLENMPLFEKFASKESVLLAVLLKMSESDEELDGLQDFVTLDEPVKRLIWPIVATVLYKSLRKAVTVETFLLLVKGFVPQAFDHDLLALVFRSNKSASWKAQFALGYLEEVAIGPEETKQVILLASGVLRSLLNSLQEEGLAVWTQFRKSKSAAARVVGVNTIDIILEQSRLDKGVCSDLSHDMSKEVAKCIYQLSL